jgi:hypothetical protein
MGANLPQDVSELVEAVFTRAHAKGLEVTYAGLWSNGRECFALGFKGSGFTRLSIIRTKEGALALGSTKASLTPEQARALLGIS